MNMINETLSEIIPCDRAAYNRARAHLKTLTMPDWALGRLLDLACDLAAMTGTTQPCIDHKAIFIMAADHGIAQEGVSLYPQEVTAQMVHNFVAGGAAINVLARQAGAQTLVVDMGVNADLSSLTRQGHVIDGKIAFGTKNFLKGPAMLRTQAEAAVSMGIQLARVHSSPFHLLGTGDMGIGNTTSSAAVAAVCLDQPVENLTGHGTGINKEALFQKIKIIEAALELHRPDPHDPLDIISKVGGFEIAALAGLILGAAALKKPIIVDGYISTAACLLAHKFSPTCLDYVIASHASGERGHPLMWEFLGKKPLLDLGMRLGEGTGSALAMNLVEGSVRIMKEMATFESAKVSQAQSPVSIAPIGPLL